MEEEDRPKKGRGLFKSPFKSPKKTKTRDSDKTQEQKAGASTNVPKSESQRPAQVRYVPFTTKNLNDRANGYDDTGIRAATTSADTCILTDPATLAGSRRKCVQ